MSGNTTEQTRSPTTSTSVAESSPAAQKPPKILSCVLCQQRKVKCDKKQPCSNCVKSRAQCVPATKAPSRPRKRRAESELIARLRRYEKYMKAHGIDIDADDSEGEDSDASQGDDPTGDASSTKKYPSRQKALSVPPDTARGKLILDPHTGKSRYIDNNLWTELSRELGDTKESLLIGSEPEALLEDILQTITTAKDIYPDGGSLLLGYNPPNMTLHTHHPQPVHIFRLWQTFLDNVYPIVMNFHAPTVQQQLLKASSDLANTPNDIHALMFAIYSCAITSLSNEECEQMLGEPQATLLAKYHTAAQHALMRANFLKSPDISTLQAYYLFLISVRSHYDPRGLWVLTGVSIRMAQRLGLHRDGLTLGLSPFEVQVRRRLWWALNILDGRLSEMAGAGVSLFHSLWDTQVPLNINDSDLNPDMKELPVEHRGLTEMAFFLVGCEVGVFLKSNPIATGFDGFWSKLSNRAISVAEKDRVIDDFENLLEDKYLRYCDPSIPLHSMTAMAARGVVCKMRLTAHHPRQYPDRAARMSQVEKDLMFNTSLKAIEIDNFCQTSPNIKRFKWHVMAHFQLDAFVYLLSELRHNTTGDLVEKAWQQVHGVYDNRKKILEQPKNPLFAAIGALTLKSWESREASYEKQYPGQGGLPTPSYIESLRARRVPAPKPPQQDMSQPTAPTVNPPSFAMPDPQLNTDFADPSVEDTWQTTNVGWDPMLLPESMSMDMSPMDWEYWNGLIQGGTTPMENDRNMQSQMPHQYK